MRRIIPIVKDFIFGITNELLKDLIDGIEVSEQKFIVLMLETVVFCMHCVDRISFLCFSEKERSMFMDELFEEVVTSLAFKFRESGITLEFYICYTMLEKLYNQRQKQYWVYNKLMSKNKFCVEDSSSSFVFLSILNGVLNNKMELLEKIGQEIMIKFSITLIFSNVLGLLKKVRKCNGIAIDKDFYNSWFD